MRSRLFLILLTIIALATGTAFADLVTLQDHVIDTGAYMLLTGDDYQQVIPLSEDVEGFAWRSDRNQVFGTMVFIVEFPFQFNDSEALGFMTRLMETETIVGKNNMTGTIYQLVSLPYPGWVTSVRDESRGLDLIAYIGNLTTTEIVTVITEEDASTAAFILENLRVYPIKDKSALMAKKVADRLR